MWIVFTLIGFLGVPICAILLIINLIRKKKIKSYAVSIGVCFLSLIIGAVLSPPLTETANTDNIYDESSAIVTTTLETTTIATTTTTVQTSDTTTAAAETSNSVKPSTAAPTTVPKTTVRNLNEQEVYIPQKGKKYHYNKYCSNGNYTPVPLYKAKEMGYSACSKCGH